MSDEMISAINEKVKRESAFVEKIIAESQKILVGQKHMMQRLLVGLLANGHILLEGVPGLAKTTAVKAMSDCIQTGFQRLQFTPDMLPADVLGTLIYDQRTGEFSLKKGPIFSNIVLADEINRAPAKVQSALLEAMQERQVTIGDKTIKLDEPFLVLATQNPIEQEGTYPLPEAQVDRFMLKVTIDYPTKEEELVILKRMAFTNKKIPIDPVVTPEDIIRARQTVDDVYMDEKIQGYIVDLVNATRDPKAYKLDGLAELISCGSSPRATINLTLASKAFAFLQGRGYVTPQDVKTIGMDVFRHRVTPSYEAEAQELTSEDLVRKIFDGIEVP